jgi:hypothetical protein
VTVCTQEEPFRVRLAAPIAIQDTTRPDYYAVFLAVEEQADDRHQRLHALRATLLATLEPMREDLRPELLEQPFLPHVTLALGLGEIEANRLVRAMRDDPLEAEFSVGVIWLVALLRGDGARYDRYPILLGRVDPLELLRD